MATPAGTASTCPRCSEPFGCGVASGACWCAGVTLDDAVRADFARFYDGCLCPTCLHALEATRPARQPVKDFLARQLRRSWAELRRRGG